MVTEDFKAPVLLANFDVNQGCVFADFNLDGKLDVAFGSVKKLIGVFTGNGDGSFNPRADYTTSGYVRHSVRSI